MNCAPIRFVSHSLVSRALAVSFPGANLGLKLFNPDEKLQHVRNNTSLKIKMPNIQYSDEARRKGGKGVTVIYNVFILVFNS